MPLKDPIAAAAYRKEYHLRNKEKRNAQCREWSAKQENKDARRERGLSQYGITSEDYERMCIEQNFSCKICKTHITEVSGRYTGKFMVDHCHTTGKVRGLLCHNCNVGLGNFKDNLDYLKAAIAYLEEA